MDEVTSVQLSGVSGKEEYFFENFKETIWEVPREIIYLKRAGARVQQVWTIAIDPVSGTAPVVGSNSPPGVLVVLSIKPVAIGVSRSRNSRLPVDHH